MTTTENYGMKKPESNDYVSIDVINENMDVIDEKLKDNADHSSNTSNPHKVTKSHVGLGDVPNVATNDQTPTYTQASTLANLVSGEKLSVSFGKIMKGLADLISHLANKSNPHEVTASQVGAAASNHSHSAADIGALPLTGGTLSGDLVVSGGDVTLKTLASISGSDTNIALNIKKDASNIRTLQLLSQSYKSAVQEAIRMQETVSGTATSYKLYGEHNVTKGTSGMTAGSSALTTGCVYLQYS